MKFCGTCVGTQPSGQTTDTRSMQKPSLGYGLLMNANWALGLLLVGGVACTSPNSSKACSSGTCSNPDFPYCDAEGVISGEPGTCIAVTCTPGAVETCLDDDALTCNTTGDGYEHVHCELGCRSTATPHCR